jgi:hypothetical protein
MSENTKPTEQPPFVGASGSATCPHCGSSQVSGLVAAFWVAVDAIGRPEKPLHECVDSDTEIGLERLCRNCGKEWNDGDPPPNASPSATEAVQ